MQLDFTKLLSKNNRHVGGSDMKIRIYYAEVIPAPGIEKRDGEFIGKDVDEKALKHRLVWSGTDRDLDFAYTEDKKTLESVFNYFNRDEPEDFVGDFRAFSIGDVVCLEDRCYICQTMGWRKLENFGAENPELNE